MDKQNPVATVNEEPVSSPDEKHEVIDQAGPEATREAGKIHAPSLGTADQGDRGDPAKGRD
jgi:hypothetical protein